MKNKKVLTFLLSALCMATTFVSIPLSVSADEQAAVTPTETVTTLDAGDSSLVYAGVTDNAWDYVSTDVVSTNTVGDSVSYSGTFTQIEWWGEASENMTSANVYIDGNLIINHWPVRDVSERNTSELLFTSGVLTRGEHTLKIEHSGAAGSWVAVDKIVVYDDQVKTTSEKIDDADSRMVFSGFGAYGVGDGFYKNTVHSTNAANDSMTLTCNHVRKFVLYTDRVWTRGRVDIYIDEVKQTTLNLYDGLTNDQTSYPVWVSKTLDDSTHTLKVVATGTKDVMATDCWVAIDAVEVISYETTDIPVKQDAEFDDSSFGYVGKGWSRYTSLGGFYYQGTAHSTFTVGDYVTASFYDAESIAVYGTKSYDRGKADVYLDGQFVETIDTFNNTLTSSQVIWKKENLEKGIHTVKIVNKGETSGAGIWLEIDKMVVKGLNENKMLIHAENNAFIRTEGTVKEEQNGLAYLVAYKGDKITALVKGGYITVLTKDGYTGKAKITVDGGTPVIVNAQGKSETLYTVEGLDNSLFHKIVIEGLEESICFNGILTDDGKLTSIDADMYDRAIQEIEERKSGDRTTSDPSTWMPVDYIVSAPIGGVTLTGGIMKQMADRTQTYLMQAVYQKDGVESHQEFWVDILSGSNEGRLMQGYANSLLWQGENAVYFGALESILNTIRARQLNQNGYALPYDESAMNGYPGDAANDERRNYDRAMFTRGLISAGAYYESIGIATEDNLAYTILRDFYDWFNYNSNEYGLSMLEGFLGVQGHPGSTLTYFTPVGKTEDMTYAELCYVQNWWMEYLIAGLDEAVWRFPLNRPHCYLITAMDAYLDHYRATGNTTYLNACKAFWEIMKNNFIHEGGAMAICEHQTYEPRSYYLESANHTGELCGSVFWTDFNYKMLQLFPEEEKYATEIERSIINILAGAQDESGRIRYHQNLNNEKNGAEKVNSCCEVTSTGLLTRLQSFIYQISSSGVTVSLYNSSTLNVNRDGKNFALTTTGDMLTDSIFTIKVTGDAMVLRLRIPSWAKSSSITVNGMVRSINLTSGSYVTISVNTNDVIVLNFEREFSAIDYVGYSQIDGFDRAYLTYGPTLMAIVPTEKYSVYSNGTEGVIDVGCTKEEFLATVNMQNKTAGLNGEFTLVPYANIQRELFTCVPIFRKSNVSSTVTLPSYENKDLNFDFSSKFDFYAQGSLGFSVNGGKLYSAEEGKELKAILKDYVIQDGADIRFTLSSIVKGGKIDGGLYIGVKDGVANTIDTITAYVINVERGVNSDSYLIKIHSFSYNGGTGKYNGCVAMAQFTSDSDTISIRVYVKDGNVYVYNEQSTVPDITATLDVVGGGIGLRAFNVSMKFDLLSFVGASDEPLVDNQGIADVVSGKIAAIPEKITLNDKALIEQARQAYDALTDEQKALVVGYDKLTSAETEIIRLEENKSNDKKSGCSSSVGGSIWTALASLSIFAFFKKKKRKS